MANVILDMIDALEKQEQQSETRFFKSRLERLDVVVHAELEEIAAELRPLLEQSSE